MEKHHSSHKKTASHFPSHNDSSILKTSSDDISMQSNDSYVKNRIKYFEAQISQQSADDEDEYEMDTLKLALSRKNEFTLKLTHPTRSNPNIKLSDFYLICTLGKGSFGRVLLSYHKTDRRFYALKVLQKTELLQHRQVENTLNERNILNACDHPNILKLHKTFKDNSCLYFMMEVCLNADLYSLLKKRKSFDEKQARFYAANVFLAFEYLHANNVIFRDLKPENVLIEANGYLKLIDFGFSKRLGNVKTKTVCGTPDYLSPEVLNKKSYGKSVDWWAFGIFIYEMNAGKPPFRHQDEKEHLFTAIRRGTFDIPDKFSPTLRDICQRIIEKDPNRRLGCQKRGSNDIKEHRWFSRIDWFLLYKQILPAPYVPKKQDPLDLVEKSRDKSEEPLKIAKVDYFYREFADF